MSSLWIVVSISRFILPNHPIRSMDFLIWYSRGIALLWRIEIFLRCSNLGVTVFAECCRRIQLLRSKVYGCICVGRLRQMIDAECLIIVCARLLLVVRWKVCLWRWRRCGHEIRWRIGGQFLCVCRWSGSVVVLLCLRNVLEWRGGRERWTTRYVNQIILDATPHEPHGKSRFDRKHRARKYYVLWPVKWPSVAHRRPCSWTLLSMWSALQSFCMPAIAVDGMQAMQPIFARSHIDTVGRRELPKLWTVETKSLVIP